MATVAKLNVQIGADLKGLEQSLSKAQRSLQAFGSKMTAVGAGLSKGLTAPLVGFATASVFAFDKQAKAIAQVEQGIKSTGNAAGIASKELQSMASALQENSLFGDEEILSKVTAQLLTFTNIAGREFKRTQQAALDLASRLGGDLQSASIQLGKALNDPVANLSALSRSGIQFSKDQKALIDSLVETGNLAEAQRVILSELEKQYGGSAKAAAEAGAGGITQLKNSFGDLMEQVGEVVTEAITPFVNALRDLVKRLQSTDRELLKFYVTIGALAAAIGPLLVGMGLLIKSLSTINALLLVTLKNPYVLVAAGVVALTGYYAKLFIQAKKTKDLLNEPFDSTASIDDQIKQSIKVVEALDKRVEGLRKNLGVGVTTEAGLEAQQRQLRVAENRLSVERLLLADLIAQSKELGKQAPLTERITKALENASKATVSVEVDQAIIQLKALQSEIKATGSDTDAQFDLDISQALAKLSELKKKLEDTAQSYQTITATIEKNKEIIDSILDTTAEISAKDMTRVSQLIAVNNALQSELALRQKIAELNARGVSTTPGRVTETPDTGGLQARRVDSERYNNSLAVLGSRLQRVNYDADSLRAKLDEVGTSTMILSDIGNQFVDSFGAGMANVIVQGEKLQDVLKNIGKLLLSSAIQTGIKLLLGGTSAFGIAGGTSGLIGAIFGKSSVESNFAPANLGGFTKAQSVVDVRVQDVRITNKDIVLSFNRGQQFLR